MGHNLNSLLKGGYVGDYLEDYYRVIKGDTRSLDYSSHCGPFFHASKNRRASVFHEIPMYSSSSIQQSTLVPVYPWGPLRPTVLEKPLLHELTNLAAN